MTININNNLDGNNALTGGEINANKYTHWADFEAV